MKTRLAWAAARAAAVLVAFLSISIASRPGVATAAEVSISVLGLEATEGAPESVAATMSDALRQQVSRTRGYKLVPGRDLVEIKLVFACPDEAAACMVDAAKNIGASKLVFGNVRRAGDSYLVTLKLLDTGSGKITGYVAEQLARGQASAGALREPAQKWLVSLTGQGGGSIRVTADLSGASIALDGLPVGVTGADPVSLPNVSVGRHDVTVTKPGFDPVKRSVTVSSGETADVSVQLAAAATSAAPLTPATGPIETGVQDSPDAAAGGGSSLLKTMSWVTLGASAVALGLGIKYSMDINDTNSKLDPYRRFPCEGNMNQICNDDGMPAARLTEAERAEKEALQSDGRSYETMQYVFYGVGGALLATSGVLLYKAYFSEDSGEVVAKSSSRPQLVVAPTWQPGAGAGLGASLTF